MVNHIKTVGIAIFNRYFREGRDYRIYFGPLSGCKITFYKSAMSYREALGFWEYKTLRIMKRLAKALKGQEGELCIADIGANIGYYCLFFSKFFPTASIYAFEPSPGAVSHLARHIRINHFDRVKIVEAAVAAHTGEIEFYHSKNLHLSSLNLERAGSGGVKTKVKAVTLDDFFEQQGSYPDLIKMDIEGGAVFALRGSQKCFTLKRPILFIESHEEAEDQAIGEHMVRFRYKAFRINTRKWVMDPGGTYKNPDGVWGSMVLIPAEQRLDEIFI